ncbi:MAG: pyridoxal-phosphate dependent enzyme [Lachnospiraceae bacterium]|nr:pyridoxal-phosphate dependent enzyme [Lachnospiraceae bacterium]
MNKIALFEKGFDETPVAPLSGDYGPNRYFIKRDDMLPFSFGGNKARKAAEFYKEIKDSPADVVMTYGSNGSNHCRIIANMAAAMGLLCHIISPAQDQSSGGGIRSSDEGREEKVLYNTRLVAGFGAVIETCPVSMVARTIENRKKAYRTEGKVPYFITGGGHGNPGTQGYVKAYREIQKFEEKNGIYFDYIFHASGTGTTQAGLVCGRLLSGDQKRNIVGISIAREKERGRDVVKDSIREYLGADFERLYREEELVFTDAYRLGGYGQYHEGVREMIQRVMKQEGIPMDTTYVGKAFWGMCQYVEENGIKDKNILFIHTGGTPLFFDNM